ncbi:PDZ domain-containing protein [Paraflavitalea sp. CAU 1676]|uniref:M61 family metallopeptidase n=1 Tax=Paraflavitalea sp. CAU 1676 TaxID=3032598 RepID=UPI0023DA1EF1|nr:PDZ domain-containing protein [Paraflavitalea sp. CAU 1676]MDF2189485.1 PDZ domain-containing protein [Paraflavitalea sp. CAU 1676]
MKKLLLFSLCTSLITTSFAQKLSYIVSFPNIIHHEAKITVIASDIPQKTATFRMSRSSPGRYATHEFGKNVYDVKAFDRTNKPLAVNRTDGDVYEVPRNDGYVKLEYTLYANHPDGTYAGIDETNAHFNMPAVFMWVKGMENAPIDINFEIPAGKTWTVATQLKPIGTSGTLFSAPNLQYFMDSPTKLGELIWKDWTIKNANGKSYQFRLALEAKTSDTAAASFAKKVQTITEEAQAVFGEVPAYDFGTYTFISSINPWVKGDGMEHRNSTMISLPTNFDGGNYLLDVFSHEFFHCWNVERIRPKTLEPFNFEKSNMSNELWCAEGFTQYYGDLLMTRSGFQTVDEYMFALAGLINTKENSAGAKRFSPAEMSRHAVFVDAGVAVDKSNYVNMYTSYYPYGGAIALALDLELRSKFTNLTLDSYMTALWKKFGKPEQPYTIPGLEGVLADLTGDKQFASTFFSKYVTGHESFDYKPLLAKAGLILKKANETKAWIGNVQYKEGNNLAIASNTVIGSPLYNAGLDVDDQIITLDGKPVKKQSDIEAILKDHKPGDAIQVEYQHRGNNKTATLSLIGNPAYSLVTVEKEGQTPTADMLSFRNNWLGKKVK